MIEVARGVAWVVATLRASSAFTAACPGGVHEGIAPANTAYPLCQVSVQSPGNDVPGAAGYRQMTTPLINVSIWGLAENGWSALVSAADAADSALQQARHGSPPSADADIMFSVREQPVVRTVSEAGVLYSVLGGLYRLQVRSLN